jgi:hypothetical protein
MAWTLRCYKYFDLDIQAEASNESTIIITFVKHDASHASAQ